MSRLLDRTLSLALTIAALAIAANLLAPWVGVGRAATGVGVGQERRAPVVENWREGLQFGLPLYGSPNAPVVIMEFSDFECPFCKQFHEVLRETALADPNRVHVVYMAFPLPTHRFARPAARAAECAHRDGQLSAWVNQVYAMQDSLGLVPWGELAARAGIEDTSRISVCARESADYPRIEGALEFGRKHGVEATPTIWINGTQFKGGLARETLGRLIEEMARRGR